MLKTAEESVETRERERAGRRVEEREWNRSGKGKGQDRVKSGKGEGKEETVLASWKVERAELEPV